MASEYSTRLDMVKRGVVPAIVQLLASPVPDVLQHSLQLLVRLLAEYDVRQSMVELGGRTSLGHLHTRARAGLPSLRPATRQHPDLGCY